MFYDLATLTLSFGTAGQAAARVLEDSRSAPARGELLGCWLTDIGPLNQLLVLRGFEQLEDLMADRVRIQNSPDPLGCASFLQGLEMSSYRGFPWMKPLRPSQESGLQGPVYEIRTYGIKPGGVQPTIDLWEKYLPARHRLSPCLVAMVALDGPLRFTNVWAYPSVDERSRLRAAAVAEGIWPPPGGPGHLTTQMSSVIALPTAISPLK